ncbi:hypothetical protein U9M48_010954 [Paspalum notatum var. saurae]|uniref:Uncharacterized protein n=1 Tax=Paspalum notatum var. saurae TaxID=547442 RepID=A0AAQ3SW55_PASNO
MPERQAGRQAPLPCRADDRRGNHGARASQFPPGTWCAGRPRVGRSPGPATPAAAPAHARTGEKKRGTWRGDAVRGAARIGAAVARDVWRRLRGARGGLAAAPARRGWPGRVGLVPAAVPSPSGAAALARGL